MNDFLRSLLPMTGMLAAAFVIVAVATQLETVLDLDALTNDFMTEIQKATATQ